MATEGDIETREADAEPLIAWSAFGVLVLVLLA
jgi:hypothetical protein